MWRRRSVEDFRAEVEAHLELEAERLREQGLTANQAHATARKTFGNVGQAVEHFYETRRALWWDHVRQDVSFGLRLLTKTPGFTAVALLTLALAIGATTVVFSAVYAVLLKPLPFPNADRLVAVWQHNPARGWERNTVSPAEILAWRDESRVFEYLGAFAGTSCVLAGRSGAEDYPCEIASSAVFPLLGVAPLRGRTFSPEDDQPQGVHDAILSSGFWQAHFGGDEGVIGRWIDINGASYRIVGIMPSSFSHLYAEPGRRTPAMWISGIDLSSTDLWNNDIGIGRLRAGVDLRQASAMMDSVSRRLSAVHPQIEGWRAQLLTLRSQASADTRVTLMALMAAVTFVLLIACANMANLLLARGAARSGEFAARRVLGARGGRLARQLLTETLLLSIGGGTLGLVLAVGGCKALAAVAPPELRAAAPGLDRGPADVRVLAFAAGTVLITTILFGLAPALESLWSPNAGAALRDAATGTVRSRMGRRMRSGLVISEIALAAVLLIGAGLMVRTLVTLTTVPLGFNSSHVLTMRLPLAGERYASDAARVRFWDDVVRRVDALPGIEAASASGGVPVRDWAGQFFTTGEQPSIPGGDLPSANYVVVGPQYFRVLEVPLRVGRTFDARDGQLTPRVAIINETMAREHWPGQNPIGHRVRIMLPDGPAPWRTIVGVVGDVHTRGPDTGIFPELYIPQAQYPTPIEPNALIVRTTGLSNAQATIESVTRAVHEVDPMVPATDVISMERIVQDATVDRRAAMALMLALALCALVLAAVGIYSVLSYSVAQQTREIGLRIALGARPGSVLRLCVGDIARLALIGIAIGAAAAWPLTALMKDLLFGVHAGDPVITAGMMLTLLMTALVAAYVPARRAMRANPTEALRVG